MKVYETSLFTLAKDLLNKMYGEAIIPFRKEGVR